MLNLSSSKSGIILNINDLNKIIKRQRLAAWIKVHNQTVHCLQKKMPFKYNDTAKLKIKAGKLCVMNILVKKNRSDFNEMDQFQQQLPQFT